MKKIIEIIFRIFYKLQREIYQIFFPFIKRKINNLQVKSVNRTISSLINSKRSISRFGDGEIRWIFGKRNYGSFEKSSLLLRERLLEVLRSNKDNLEIGLPNSLCNINLFTNPSIRYWKGFWVKYWSKFSKYLNFNKIYYNTNISRFYIDFKDKKNAKNTFSYLKRIWNNRNILIVEGKYTRLGVSNDLFENSNIIKRIECPPIDAFERYNKILNIVKRFLSNHKNFLILIALGPTATVLSYDLSNLGFQAIDIGHVDLEYEWYLHGAKHRINIPTRYVNSLTIKNGHNVSRINDKEFKDQIYTYIN